MTAFIEVTLANKDVAHVDIDGARVDEEYERFLNGEHGSVVGEWVMTRDGVAIARAQIVRVRLRGG